MISPSGKLETVTTTNIVKLNQSNLHLFPFTTVTKIICCSLIELPFTNHQIEWFITRFSIKQSTTQKNYWSPNKSKEPDWLFYSPNFDHCRYQLNRTTNLINRITLLLKSWKKETTVTVNKVLKYWNGKHPLNTQLCLVI